MDNLKKNITFSGTILVVNNMPISIDIFKEKIKDQTYSESDKKRVQIYTYDFHENYLKIKVGDGSAMPRNSIIYDVETSETLPNPRLPSHAEPKEIFGLIDFNSGFLWISDLRKKNLLLDFFRTKLDKNTLLVSKDVYDEKKFIETINKLDNIKLSAAPEIFSQSGVLSGKLAEEINGYEATTAQLEFQYNNKTIGNNLREILTNLFITKNNFKGIVISGRDKNNLGMLFNLDGISRKIDFKTSVDDNEMFIPENVFNQLITIIQNENN